MAIPSLDPLTDTLSAPLGDLIAAVGRGVADAQQAMDARTIENLQALAEASEGDPLALLRQIGYQPTWYQIPEVTAEMTVALTVTGSGTESGSGQSAKVRLHAAPVDASYANRYGYELKAASSVKFRIVPIPASPRAERMRAVPAVLGLTFAAAQARVAELDIAWRLAEGAKTPSNETLVAKQTPAPGALLSGDDSVEFDF